MEYVIKRDNYYVSKDGVLTPGQRDAVHVDMHAKPFLTPDVGYRFVRVRPREEEESEPLQD